MIVQSAADIAASPVFIRLRNVLDHAPMYVKLEGLNAAGSIKLKTARQIVADLEAAGTLRPGGHVIESSSGNLGVALALICAQREYQFTCVSDPNISPATRRLVAALGGKMIIVRDCDPHGGYLKTRIDLIRSMVERDPRLVWTNQYANRSNSHAHYLTTGPEIMAEFGKVDWIFVGAGTTGTLGGTARYFREHSPATRIVAVDTVGSVTFGTPPGKRHLPGIGTSLRPTIAADCEMDRLILVPEYAAVAMCRRLAAGHGLLLGASSGSVISAAVSISDEILPNHTAVALSPDFGDHYLETLYDDEWIKERFCDADNRFDHGVVDGAVASYG